MLRNALALRPRAGAAAACPQLLSSTRLIRTQIPPRPAVTVITYLDHYGNPVKTKEETDLTLIRTRDNKFYLQRVFADESVVRFVVPGLGMIKNAANFEYFSLGDIDLYGGVIIPGDVAPTSHQERPGFHDAVYVIMKCKPTTKFTRKDRRTWHRKLFSHWQEDPEKYQLNTMITALCLLMPIGYLIARHWAYTRRGIDPSSNGGLNNSQRDDTLWARSQKFAERHPEHLSCISSTVELTPAQQTFSQARSEMRDKDITDPALGFEMLWKFRHAAYYGHWPKGLQE
jgi:hypothetical protein